MKQDEEQHAYRNLGPDDILRAVEHLGYHCDGRFLALNSYENRVYQIGLEGRPPVIAKFYRPGRWSDAAILEEHAFTRELCARELPVVAPLADENGQTLFYAQQYRLALFPRCGGRAPELDNPNHLEILGRYIGRLHAVGIIKPFVYRPTLDIDHFAIASYQYILEHDFVPTELIPAYRSLAEDLVTLIKSCYQRAGNVHYLRLHGDCHPGNILWTNEGPHIVDFDDVRMGPAIQDLWMFLSGDRAYMTIGLADLLTGYTDFMDFDPRELHLVEALRTMRMMHYAAWLARRWGDPAFPAAFPWFNSGRYWEEHILALREQAALLTEPALEWH
jgi:Ser/Thr protein kinase RdoA (MazF antagonist)